jgi:K+-transporting ATPase KdpF subunit
MGVGPVRDQKRDDGHAAARDARTRAGDVWGDVRLREVLRESLAMFILALILSVAAFAYLVYAMLRPEKF